MKILLNEITQRKLNEVPLQHPQKIKEDYQNGLMHQINQKRMPAQQTSHPDKTGSGKIRQMEVPFVVPVKNFSSEGSKENHSKPWKKREVVNCVDG